jgi:superfamily II DNA or RNA helicase
MIAGIILDNYCRGRTKHVWVSTSADLHADAMRDLRDLGMQLPVINNCSALDAGNKAGGLSKDCKEGVLFLTYSTLISAGRKGMSRFDQVMQWLGGPAFEGCIIFDECHRCRQASMQTGHR